MQASEYEIQFGRTIADNFFPLQVHPVYVGQILRNRHQAARFVDAVKRALYYDNRDRLDQLVHGAVKNPINVAFNVEPTTLHAILGMEGEVAEITEAALKGDRAKILDEAGDFLWYLALLLRRHGITFDEVFAGNIAKLKVRFPEKFTLEQAVERDLEAEAQVLQ